MQQCRLRQVDGWIGGVQWLAGLRLQCQDRTVCIGMSMHACTRAGACLLDGLQDLPLLVLLCAERAFGGRSNGAIHCSFEVSTQGKRAPWIRGLHKKEDIDLFLQ